MMLKPKKMISLVLSLTMCLGLFVQACAIDDTDAESIMSAEDSTRIIIEYQDEIQFIESYVGTTIEEINADTLNCIIDATNEFKLNGLDTSLRFDDLLNCIVDAGLEMQAERMNSARGYYVNNTYTRMNNSAQYVRGEYVTSLGVSQSKSISDDFSIGANTEINLADGKYKLGASVSFSATSTNTYSGPSSTDKLSNGRATTQHLMFKAILGYIVLHEYDYIDDYGHVTHFSQYEVDKNSSRVFVYTAYVSALANGFQIENASRDKTFTYTSWIEVENDVVTRPGRFISSTFYI